MKKQWFLFAVCLIFLMVSIKSGEAFGIGIVDGVWEYVEDGGNDSATCDAWASVNGENWSQTNPGEQGSGGTSDENQIRYGDVEDTGLGCPNTWDEFLLQSGFGVNGINGFVDFPALGMDEPFFLGRFYHYNNPIIATDINLLEWVDVRLEVPVDCDDDGDIDTTFTMYPRFHLDETPNEDDPCPYLPGDPVNINGCADAVTIEQPTNPTFSCTIDEVTTQYVVNVLGFISGEGGFDCSLSYDTSRNSLQYITVERQTNNACLWAEIDAPTADVGVAKTCTGFDGEDPHYTITVINNGPGNALGAKIVDTLPAGVTFSGYTSLKTYQGTTAAKGTCTAAGQTVTCELLSPLSETDFDPTAKWVVDISVDLVPGSTDFVNNIVLTTTSIDNNPGNNTGTATCYPTAVTMGSFEAELIDRQVLLTWQTLSELDTLGFNLYYSIVLGGERIMVNDQIIQSLVPPGSVLGASYQFYDSFRFERLGMLYYWLEEIGYDGDISWHGPISIGFTGPLILAMPEPIKLEGSIKK